ncbi:endonuclease domain-containing protein [Brevundimonas viscosa]|uniref:Very-short-patch-repair endonuclease n=1 Tax=Brevundimonas viscosa TaxID=871741 RepID=A0A1I6PYY2_9CAUL|nr:endonuclease domain-containing protein [Brevundimonas viscosa]SFS45384.1 Very-short-patch-repair endonuclease [Brevundimonas viscosa]
MQQEGTVRRARRLRKAPTKVEAILWRHLRQRQVAGLRFRRQVPIGPYVMDFACFSQRLVVEVDGGVHDLRTFDDSQRDDWLAGQGFRVLRFTNGQVEKRPHEVIAAIAAHTPSPISGEGVRRSLTDGGSVHIRIGEGGAPAESPHPSRSAAHLPPKRGRKTVGSA